MHVFDPSTWDAKAGRSLSVRLVWSTKKVPRLPGIYRKSLFQKKEKKRKKMKRKYQERLKSMMEQMGHKGSKSYLLWWYMPINSTWKGEAGELVLKLA